MTGKQLLDSLSKLFGPKIQDKTEFRGETTYTILPRDLREVAQFCRDELSFDYLIDITSIDNFGEEPRFEIVYELYSLTLAVHLRLKLRVSEEIGAVDTVSDIWPTANWHEREIYDMMGLKFNGHPDLRRILMWDGYPVLSAAQRISARRFAQRHARRRLQRSRAHGRRPVRHDAIDRDDKRSRAARPPAGFMTRQPFRVACRAMIRVRAETPGTPRPLILKFLR